ncbi:hypothetical protein Godav_028363 [Gossypium davidsonii]|uniref:Uncharacterized protein n=1 Tax=Gossypium davidsonii TaxID=34287 RepID=A0A7J8RZU3_GOSDV|nr:hypothetical protein [Gossypium davidsonii]
MRSHGEGNWHVLKKIRLLLSCMLRWGTNGLIWLLRWSLLLF